jgi:CRP/FNR family transcriptional regulator
MSDAVVLDLARLRRSCGQCTLRQLCLPAGIGADDIDRLDRIVKRRRSIASRERLFSAGSELRTLYVAREGSFKTVALSEDGQQQVVGFHLPGELMGLDALAAGRHRCDAEALEPAGVCEVPLEDLERVAAQVPALQHQLLRVIGGSMGRDQDHMEMLGRRQADERVLLFLHGLMERYRTLGKSDDLLVLSMSREDIASYLGLVIETVSRCFGRLQDDGVIAVHGRQVRVLDAGRFAALAHGAVTDGRQSRLPGK